MSTDVILVCCYSGLLLALAYGFDLMAKRVALRAQRWPQAPRPMMMGRSSSPASVRLYSDTFPTETRRTTPRSSRWRKRCAIS